MKHRELSVLYSAEEISERIESLSIEIAAVAHKEVVLIALLRGGFMFAADLARALSKRGITPSIDFLRVSSYGSDTESSGNVAMLQDFREDVTGREVLIVDDILDTGHTLAFVHDLCIRRGASQIHSAVLLEKPSRRAIEIEADFVGFEVPNRFIVGYGLDYAGHYRELPYIGWIDIH